MNTRASTKYNTIMADEAGIRETHGNMLPQVQYSALTSSNATDAHHMLVTDHSSKSLPLRDRNETCPPPSFLNKPSAPKEHLDTGAETVQIARKEHAGETAYQHAKRDSRKTQIGTKGIFQMAAIRILGFAGLTLGCLAFFALLYLLKCLMGIDIFPETHLKDFL